MAEKAKDKKPKDSWWSTFIQRLVREDLDKLALFLMRPFTFAWGSLFLAAGFVDAIWETTMAVHSGIPIGTGTSLISMALFGKKAKDESKDD